MKVLLGVFGFAVRREVGDEHGARSRGDYLSSPRVVYVDPRPTLKPTPLPKSVIKLQFLSKSRPRPWTLAVLVFQKSSASLGAHNEQPAIPGTRRAALGIVASSSLGLFPQQDELFASHRHPVSAAESCCPRTPLLAAAGWGGAGQGAGMGTTPLFIDQTTTKPLCMTEQSH